MTWSKLDDAARRHPKAVVAGNEAWSFWVAAIQYSNQNLTDGFVPEGALATEVMPVAMAPKRAKELAEKLVAARIRKDGHGLFEPAEGGYVVHDFLDWNPSKEEIETKRRKDRDRKRTGIPDGFQSGIQTDSARNPDGRRADSDLESAPRVRPRAGARPDPTEPARPSPPSPAEAAAPVPPQRFRMHLGWQPSETSKATVLSALVEPWALPVFIAEFVGHFAESDEEATNPEWNRRWQKWVFRGWNDSSKRPKRPPEADAERAEMDRRWAAAKAQGDRMQAELRAADERRKASGQLRPVPAPGPAQRKALDELTRGIGGPPDDDDAVEADTGT